MQCCMLQDAVLQNDANFRQVSLCYFMTLKTTSRESNGNGAHGAKVYLPHFYSSTRFIVSVIL
jgi:hypothetical protein